MTAVETELEPEVAEALKRLDAIRPEWIDDGIRAAVLTDAKRRAVRRRLEGRVAILAEGLRGMLAGDDVDIDEATGIATALAAVERCLENLPDSVDVGAVAADAIERAAQVLRSGQSANELVMPAYRRERAMFDRVPPQHRDSVEPPVMCVDDPAACKLYDQVDARRQEWVNGITAWHASVGMTDALSSLQAAAGYLEQGLAHAAEVAEANRIITAANGARRKLVGEWRGPAYLDLS